MSISACSSASRSSLPSILDSMQLEDSASIVSCISSESEPGSHASQRIASSFRILAESDSGKESVAAGSSRSLLSRESGTTIYSDAREVTEDLSTDDINSTHHSQSAVTSHGAVAVTPLRSSFRQSLMTSSSIDFGLNEVKRSPASALRHDSAITSAFVPSPLKPKLRASPSANVDQIIEVKRPLRQSKLVGSPLASESSPHLKKSRRPLQPIDKNLIQPSRNSAPQHNAFKFTLGKPRKPSPSQSVASTHASTQADSEGHIEPPRVIHGSQLSFIRRAGPTVSFAGPICAGLPRLPYVPSAESPKRNQNQLHSAEGSNLDPWGRLYASMPVSVLVLMACAAFPPSWLLLATGYFDHITGTIPRSIKFISLALTLFIFAAAITLVIVFSILKD